jgi:hypothetical protein
LGFILFSSFVLFFNITMDSEQTWTSDDWSIDKQISFPISANAKVFRIIVLFTTVGTYSWLLSLAFFPAYSTWSTNQLFLSIVISAALHRASFRIYPILCILQLGLSIIKFFLASVEMDLVPYLHVFPPSGKVIIKSFS